MALAFANILMANLKCKFMISLLHNNRGVVNQFNEQANEHQPKITFTAEMSISEATILDATFYKG